MRSRLSLAALAIAGVLGCHSSGEQAPSPSNDYVPPPARLVVEPGIVRELLRVDGVVPPANPTLAAETPKEQNAVRVVRYRVDATPPKAARAIVVMMPGFLAGAGAFDTIARTLVRRSATDAAGPIEAWAIDRRANYLEDTHGADVSEVRKDASWSRRYYADLEAVEGKTFHGFLDSSEVPWESEWGMATTIGDLRAVVSLVPEAERKGRVVLVGHSLGATIAEAYAAWDFDGHAGYEDLAGLVLIDGVSGDEGKPASAFDQKKYESGDLSAGGTAFTLPNLSQIRKGQPFIALPFLGVSVGEQAERIAIATEFAPTAPRANDDDTTSTLAFLLGLTSATVPKMTNRAAFGFAFDDESAGISIAAMSMGRSTGGPVATYKAAFGGTVVHPTDPAATYDWLDFDAVTPAENTSMKDALHGFFEGPGLNFIEWYFPARLTLDASFVGSLDIAEGDWRTTYGLRARHGAEIDAPILAVAAALTLDDPKATPPTAHQYDALAAMVAKTAIGPDRPLAGTPRTDPRAFNVLAKPTFTHVDPVQAADVRDGAAWYDQLVAFVHDATKPGGVVVP